MQPYPHLLQPLEFGPIKLKNRVLMGSMHTNLEEVSGGFERVAAFYGERVRGGVGLIVTGGIAPNTEGCVAAGAAKLTTEEEATHHRIITDQVHKYDGRICMQILHTGRYGYHPNIVAPSAIQAPINFFKPRELSSDDIESTIDDYVRCAQLAVSSGYDGVEIMGSEGYLINQFIALRTNQRTDEWGGTYENRIRLPIEIVRRTREAIGNIPIIIYRLSMLDLVEGGSSWSEVVILAKEIERAGASIINTGIGWHEARIPTIATSVPRGGFAWVTKKLKREVTIPLIAVNRINTPEIAEQILADGCADMVSLARPLLADADFVIKAAEDRATEINTCIACNQACLDHTFSLQISSCLVNPRACHETELNYIPTSNPKYIAVVGAGPAGLAYAHVAAMRGHKVDLYESGAQIGGQFNLAKVIPGKEEYSEMIRFYDSMIKKYKINLLLNSFATESSLMSKSYDEIILSSGIKPRHLDIPGSDFHKVVSYVDVLSEKVTVGNKVAIIGAGGIGFDVATYLSDTHRDRQEIASFCLEWGIDTDITQGGLKLPTHQKSPRTIYLLKRSKGKHGTTLGKTTGWIHKAKLASAGVIMMSDMSYDFIDDLGLHITHLGETKTLDVDHIVVCAGQEPNRDLYNILAEKGIKVTLIGGSFDAAELDAKKAIDQACREAAKV